MIEDVKMMNFISHRETSIQLEDGVNVFIGPNGAGKSSVVDAVTYALYGEHTRDSAKNIVRRGAANGFVSVTFTVGNRQYRAERRFGPKGKLEGAILREIRPNPRLIVAGERRQYSESMSDEVTKAFGLDYEKMKVATIVQQGELDSIIRYKPRELKELVNSLIGIDKLDLAYQNMRRALEGFRLNLRTECMNYDDQSIQSLRDDIQSTVKTQQDSNTQIGKLSRQLSNLQRKRATLEKELAAMEPLRAKKDEAEERKADLIDYVEKTASELNSKMQDLEDDIAKAKQYLPKLALKSHIESEGRSLDKEDQLLSQARTDLTSDLRSANISASRMETLRKEIGTGEDRINRLNKKAQTQKREIAKLKSIKVPTRKKAKDLTNKVKALEDSALNFKDNLTRIDEVLGNYKSIQSTGICPTCGSTVEEINLDAKLAAKHKEHITASSDYDAAWKEKESIKKLLEQRKDYDVAQKRLAELNELVKGYTSDIETEQKNLVNLRKESKEKSGEARMLPNLKKRLEDVETKISKLQAKRRVFQRRRDILIKAEAWLHEHKIATKQDLTQLKNKAAASRKRVKSIPKDIQNSDTKKLVIDAYSNTLATKVTELERQASQFDEVSFKAAKNKIDEQIEPEITEMLSNLGGWKQQGKEAKERLSKLKEIQDRLEEATSYLRLFEKVRSDVYNRDGILATSLRSWALRELSRNASDYIRSFGIGMSELQLTEKKRDVNIECYSASGMADVKSMSGGESVAIALALRFAMAMLMGKGMVDFIVLDEPTTHLDEERRRSLVHLVTEFNSDEKRTSLNQIVVITHDREIFEDSDVNAVFQFEKSPEGSIVTKT